MQTVCDDLDKAFQAFFRRLKAGEKPGYSQRSVNCHIQASKKKNGTDVTSGSDTPTTKNFGNGKRQRQSEIQGRDEKQDSLGGTSSEKRFPVSNAGKHISQSTTSILHKKNNLSEQCLTADIHKGESLPKSQSAESFVPTATENFTGQNEKIRNRRIGYPRFKGREHFRSFAFKQFGVGARLDGRRLKLYGIGRLAVRWHRPLEDAIKTVRIIHKAGRWYAAFACEVEAPDPLAETGEMVGIDVGISALVTRSNGVKVENPNDSRTAQKQLRRLQRKLARAKRGSHNRRKALLAVQRQQEHVANQRRDYLHKHSTELVRQYNGSALEALRVSNLVRNKHLSTSILDSGWSAFRQYLTYKAEKAGREVALVDPASTSRCCSNCGAGFQDFDLSTRWVDCVCGRSLDRDENAALNILRRALAPGTGWDTPVRDKPAPLPTPGLSEAQ